jgi:glutathione S-transferase
MQHRSAAFTAINPPQQVPALVLHDGTVIAESIAICRYFEALNPSPAMFGVGALEQAWWRCGTAVSNRTCSFRCPRSFVI